MNVKAAAPTPGDPTPLVRALWLRNIRGFSTIPLDHPGDPVASDPKQAGKVPVVKWAEYQERLPDERTIRTWFGNGHQRNIGIVCGSLSGVVVVDLDDAAAIDWARAHLPETAIKTKSSKGEHWFYRHPGKPVPTKARLRTNGHGVSVDLRGDGGYIVAPGSLHASGVKYESIGNWRTPLEELPVFDLGWIEPAQASHPPAPPRPQAATALQTDRDTVRLRVRKYLEATPPAIEGQRGDEHTYQVCCRIVRGFDLSDADAFGELQQWNQRNVPPWTDAELMDKIAGARKYGDEPLGGRLEDRQLRSTVAPISEAKTTRASHLTEAQPADSEPEPEAKVLHDPLAFALTDSGNAEYFAAQHGASLRYDHRRKYWLVWTGHRWQPDADATVRRLAKEAMRQRFRDAAALDDPDARARLAKWAVGSESRGRLDALIYLAQAENPIADPGDAWDTQTMLLGVPNGVVKLTAGTLRAGCRDDRITMCTGVAYDPDAACPRWEQFLIEIFAGDALLVDYIHRAVGYSLTGETGEQVFFVPHGIGANGKGTLLNTLSSVFGDYAYTMPFATVELHQRSAIPNDLAALAGRRFVTASETNDGTRLNEARIKALTGCDPITARFLHGEFFTFKPVGKFWLAVNHKPIVRDDSVGFWRRVRLVPFTERFGVNPALDRELRAEAPGILAWAVRGCLAWQRDGLTAPPQVLEATAVYEVDSDPLAAFLAEATEPDPSAEIRASDLYAHYRRWADRHGLTERERLSSNAFGRKMAERLQRLKTRAGYLYRGVSRRDLVTDLDQ